MFFQLDHVTFRHAGLPKESPPTLNNISLEIAAGEWVALIGANGSGKTTLARHLNGLLQPSSGTVWVDGLDTRQEKHLAAIRAKVGMVFQSPEDQIVASLVREDTAFGPENLGIPSGEIRTRVQSALENVGMWEERERVPHLLSGGQIQRVALAGVLAMQPQAILFDETTAMLDPAGKRDVLAQLAKLHKQGLTLVMITHAMDEAALADRAILLEEGQIVYDGKTTSLFEDEPLLKRCHLELPSRLRMCRMVTKYFAGVAVSDQPPEKWIDLLPVYTGKESAAVPSTDDLTDELICVEELRHSYFANTPLAHESLRSVSLHALSGRTHGLVGATGSGKSTLLQHFNGLYLPQSGKVRVGPFDLNQAHVDLHGLRHYAGLVFQNPESYFFEQYVGDEIAYGARLYYGREGLRERVQQAMTTVGLDFERFKDRLTATLSGGEKRKVALASVLVTEPELLILDEPSAGLDPFSRRILLKTLQELQSGGRGIVLSTHNMEDVTTLAQEVTVMSRGQSLGTLAVAEAFTNTDLMQSAGLIAPVGVLLATALRKRGWPLPVTVNNLSKIEPYLEQWRGGEV